MAGASAAPGTARHDRWRAMGTDVDVLVWGLDDAGTAAAFTRVRARVEELEARWSRFRPDTELVRLNARTGGPVVVSPETFAVVALAVDAWQRTGGRFDPTVYDALVAAGYDRDFASVAAHAPAAGTAAPRNPDPSPGCAGIQLDPIVRAVTLPAGVHLDLGGIAKGHTADLLAPELLAQGASGVLVSLGGDLRAVGAPPEDTGAWLVDVEDAPGTRLALGTGAIATSTSAKRHWTRGDAALHHLIDPTTGAPSTTDLRSVTVVAATAADAEVLAKVAFLAGTAEAPGVLAAAGATGLLVTRAGDVHHLDGLAPFLAPAQS